MRPSALLQHELGQYIYAYSHARTNQVLYSLKQTLDGHHSLKQLPDLGANDPKAEGRLRRDLWRPFFSISFPPTPEGTLSPHGSARNAQGLHAFRQLREWRKLHEYHWTPPASLAQPYTEEQIEELKKRYEKRGGAKKENVFDMIKREKKKIRLREVQDQKANSVADLAAVLKAQVDVRESMEDEFDAERNEEIVEMINLAKAAKGGRLEQIEAELKELEPYVERREGSRIEDGAPMSQRQARQRTWDLERERRRMLFAVPLVAEVEDLIADMEMVEMDLQREIVSVDEAANAELNPSSGEEPSKRKQKRILARTESRKRELQMILASATEAKLEILKGGEAGVDTIRYWIEKLSHASNVESAVNTAEQADGEVDAAQIPAAPSEDTTPTTADEQGNNTQIVDTTQAEDVTPPTRESSDKIRGYELMLAQVLGSEADAKQRWDEIKQQQNLRAEEDERELEKKKFKQQKSKQVAEGQFCEEKLSKWEEKFPGKIEAYEHVIAAVKRGQKEGWEEEVVRIENHKVRAEAMVQALKEVRAIRSKRGDNADGSSVIATLETRFLELEKAKEDELAKHAEGQHPNITLRVLDGRSKVFRFAIGAERGRNADFIDADTADGKVFLPTSDVPDNTAKIVENEAVRVKSSEVKHETGKPVRAEDVRVEAPEVENVDLKEDRVELNDGIIRPDIQEAETEPALVPEPKHQLIALPSFPPEPLPPDSLFPKKQMRQAAHEKRRENAPLFTMEGVKVKFNNVLDAEFAEEWPQDVIIEGMGLTKGMSAPKADAEPIYGEMEWRAKKHEQDNERSRKGVVDALAAEVVKVVQGRQEIASEEKAVAYAIKRLDAQGLMPTHPAAKRRVKGWLREQSKKRDEESSRDRDKRMRSTRLDRAPSTRHYEWQLSLMRKALRKGNVDRVNRMRKAVEGRAWKAGFWIDRRAAQKTYSAPSGDPGFRQAKAKGWTGLRASDFIKMREELQGKQEGSKEAEEIIQKFRSIPRPKPKKRNRQTVEEVTPTSQPARGTGFLGSWFQR